MSKMSRHERAIRDRIESLDLTIGSLELQNDHYKAKLDAALRDRGLLLQILDVADDIGSTPAAEEDEELPDGSLGRTPDTGEPVWEVPGSTEKTKEAT